MRILLLWLGLVLAHLQGAAATFRVGRHHHRGPLHEGQGLTHALTHTAPTDLTVAAALVRKAYFKRRRSRLWSKPVNLRTWGLVSDSIAIVHRPLQSSDMAQWYFTQGTHASRAKTVCEIWATIYLQFIGQNPYCDLRARGICARAMREGRASQGSID